MSQLTKSSPIFSVRDKLLQLIRENEVVIVAGDIGSVEITQLIQYLHADGYTKNGIVGCTQPSSVAAMSVAKRVSEEMDTKVGDKVGYAIEFEDVTGPHTVIKYMTDGVLLRETVKDSDLDKYRVIVMDEAHERSLSFDVLFGILKKVFLRRRDFKLILTSVTLNAQKSSEFFGGAPIFPIPGRTFPVQTIYVDIPREDRVKAAVKQALAIHFTGTTGDILIFMAGDDEIKATFDALLNRMQELLTSTSQQLPKMVVLPIYSHLPAESQAKIFEKAEGARKCILVGTNTAETSSTVDGISYVIDTGYCRMKVYKRQYGIDTLELSRVGGKVADLRAGRAGRTGPGTCYRLYNKKYLAEMPRSPRPAIQRSNLCNVLLLLKSLKVDKLLDFNFMDPPSKENILDAHDHLWALGALEKAGNLTPLGWKMVEFPLDPPLAKMLVTGEQLGCLDEVLTIVSMLSVPSVFFWPEDREKESNAAWVDFVVPESDHLTLFTVYQQWAANGYRSDWCNDRYLHQKELDKARNIRSHLLDILKALKISPTSAFKKQYWEDTVKKAVCSAYLFNKTVKLNGRGHYVHLRNLTPCGIHPRSALRRLGQDPVYVVYHELRLTTKGSWIVGVTAVESSWLNEMRQLSLSVQDTDISSVSFVNRDQPQPKPKPKPRPRPKPKKLGL